MTTDRVGRPTWIEVHLGAILHNIQVARQVVGPGVEVWPVVKADGYGLGAVAISRALQSAEAPGLCVAMVEEAEILRRSGVTIPLVLLSSAAPGLEKYLVQLQLQPFVYTLQDARRLAAFFSPEFPLAVHVKVDTGMGRLGFPVEDLPNILDQLAAMPGLRVVGVASHLACADDPQSGVTARQVSRLQQGLAAAGERTDRLAISLANSAGLLAHGATRFHWVRPGIMLYGANPFHPIGTAAQWGLRPVVAWKSRIVQVRELAAGTPLGYGHTFVTPTPCRVGQVPVGYADGFGRCLGGRAHVLVAGKKAAVLGRVCMDLITVDLTHIPEAAMGSQVTLLGRDGAEEILVEEMAAWMSTIPYEIFCGLGQRMPRQYLTEGT